MATSKYDAVLDRLAEMSGKMEEQAHKIAELEIWKTRAEMELNDLRAEVDGLLRINHSGHTR